MIRAGNDHLRPVSRVAVRLTVQHAGMTRVAICAKLLESRVETKASIQK